MTDAVKYLMMHGIMKADAETICAALRVSEVGDLARVQAMDLVGPLIPHAAIPALVTAVQDYRKANGITADTDAKPRLAKRDKTVTDPRARMVQMRGLVEAL
jgi:hypothetical protein